MHLTDSYYIVSRLRVTIAVTRRVVTDHRLSRSCSECLTSSKLRIVSFSGTDHAKATSQSYELILIAIAVIEGLKVQCMGISTPF